MTAPIVSDRPGVKVWIDHQDVTHHLGDLGTVRLRKTLYSPMGEANINFPDMPTKARDSLYGTIPVMAPLMIELQRDAGNWVTVLRGFVRAIGRDEQVGGDGRVQRMVTVVGHDCGAAFVMESMHRYISWQNTGLPLPQQKIWFLDWVRNRDSVLHSAAVPVDQFIQEVAVASTSDILAAAGFKWDTAITVTKGYVQPHMAQSNEGPVWEMLYRYSDAPWNELFVREGEQNPEIVFRPTPWIDAEGQILAEIIGESIAIDPSVPIEMKRVLSLSAFRDDSEVTNHIWVESPLMQTMGLAQTRDLQSGVVQPDTRKQFGDRRPTDLSTWLLPYSGTMDPEGHPQFQAKDFNGWIVPRRNWALKANALNHQMERGAIVIRGDPSFRVGDYLWLKRGTADLQWSAYVIGVSHDYQPFRRYQTTVEYIRGTQWLRRQKVPAGAWDQERAAL